MHMYISNHIASVIILISIFQDFLNRIILISWIMKTFREDAYVVCFTNGIQHNLTQFERTM